MHHLLGCSDALDRSNCDRNLFYCAASAKEKIFGAAGTASADSID